MRMEFKPLLIVCILGIILLNIFDFNIVYSENEVFNETTNYTIYKENGDVLFERIGVEVGDEYLSKNFEKYKDKIENSKILEKLSLEKNKYFIVSSHREEVVDIKENLINLIETLNALYDKYKYKIIFSTHPRTKKLIEKLIDNGYKKESIVYNTADFSVRGFVIDIFPVGEENPVRIEMFDNEIEKIKNKFDVINLNERVEKYLKNRFSIKSLEEIYNILNPKMIIVTRGKKGSDFVFDNNKVNKELSNPEVEVDPTGAGDAFFSMFISEYIKNPLFKYEQTI